MFSESMGCCCAQILWTFSIYLEAVAILPQLVLLQRTQNIDNLTGNYVFLLGCARAHPAPCVAALACHITSCKPQAARHMCCLVF